MHVFISLKITNTVKCIHLNKAIYKLVISRNKNTRISLLSYTCGKCSIISNTSQFSNKILIIGAKIHKMLVSISNREDLGLHCLI